MKHCAGVCANNFSTPGGHTIYFLTWEMLVLPLKGPYCPRVRIAPTYSMVMDRDQHGPGGLMTSIFLRLN